MELRDVIRLSKMTGQDLYTPMHAEVYLGATFTTAEMQMLQSVPFRRSVLWLTAQTHILVACGGLSLLEIWEAQCRLFGTSSSPPWYLDEPFASIKADVGWQLIRKEPLPDSIVRTWEDQVHLLKPSEEVPSSSVLAQAMLMHLIDTGSHLFHIPYVRTSDVGYEGLHASLGYFDPRGLSVNYYWDDYQDRFVGLASAQKADHGYYLLNRPRFALHLP